MQRNEGDIFLFRDKGRDYMKIKGGEQEKREKGKRETRKGKNSRITGLDFGTLSSMNKNGPILQVLQHLLPELHGDIGLLPVRLALDQVISADLDKQATRALS
jgi:hypothetical protein